MLFDEDAEEDAGVVGGNSDGGDSTGVPTSLDLDGHSGADVGVFGSNSGGGRLSMDDGGGSYGGGVGDDGMVQAVARIPMRVTGMAVWVVMWAMIRVVGSYSPEGP